MLLASVARYAPPLIPAVAKANRSFSIAELIRVSFPDVLTELKEGGNWASHELRAATASGRITFQPLGHYVEVDGKRFDVSQVSIPMVWTKSDERNNRTENRSTGLTADLLENGIQCHDDIILQMLGNGRAIVSQTYNYDLSDIVYIPSAKSYMAKIYTALAFVG